MRYTLFTLLLSMFVGHLSLYGQLQKSTHFIGSNSYSTGGVFFSNTVGIEDNLGKLEINYGEDGDRLFAFETAPRYGRFITDHWLLGSGLNFITISFKNAFFSDSQQRLLLNPFARYYFNPDRSNTHFFMETSFNRIFDFADAEFNRSGYSLGTGVTYRLNSSIVVDGTLGYAAGNIGQEDERFWSLQAAATLNILLRNGFKESRSTIPGIQKGTWLTGINDFVLAGNNAEFGNDRQLLLRPKLLYFVSNRWAIGAGINYEVTRRRLILAGGGAVINTKAGETNFEFSPQVRYYFVAPQRIMFFATAGMGFSRVRTSFDADTAQLFGIDEKSKPFTNQSIGLGLGSNVFITPNFALEFGPNVRYDFENEQTRYAIDIGLQVFLRTNEK